MPVISTSSGLVLLAAALPIAAAPAVVSPDTITAYTLVGTMLAIFLAVSYLRMNSRKAWNYPQTVFTIVATLSAGWFVPEPLAWLAVRKGWWGVTGLDLETAPKQAWALTAVIFGLGGSTVMLTIIHYWKAKFPKAFAEEETAVVQMPGSGTELHITSKKQPDPQIKTTTATE